MPGFSMFLLSRSTNDMDVIALGRQDAGCFRSWGFAARNPKPKSGTEAADSMSAVSNAWSFCVAKTPNGEKTAWMPCFARARDRRGAEQPRRAAPGPERSGALATSGCLDSPVFCGAAAKNAPKDLKEVNFAPAGHPVPTFAFPR
jgi:hypothetical protein